MRLLPRLCATSLLLLTLAFTAPAPASAQPAADVQRLADVPYGPDAAQRMDVYLPKPAQHTADTRGAPVVVMVHGGAWMFGDKEAASVVDLKVAHWVREQGFVLVSVGYRFVPRVDVMQQAQDVARAVAAVQANAASWGGDAARVVLMGHSAGAHLVALLSASPDIARQQGARPWLGAIALDSAALDTAGLMQRRHLNFYDRVFGSDPAFWRSVSPTDALAPGAPPMLLVCSTQRRDGSCTQAQQFAARVTATGGRAEVLPEDLSHAQINAELGQPSTYTAAVDAFVRSVGVAGHVAKP
ncbi:alpha/beta hydrolase [Variovorax sp. J22G73]|uniref:alpha/beta hydrolase n=1 Tax=unclassified Variovorax TaxID=663243 RepID=UPI000D5E6AF7|nr:MULTISPECIES: alpha/beta hydrolase [unclassified Variovorax]MDM0003247.1 alpha/beta hydrolase [Variovorax sp. J22R203]MDM0097087.1 alpha/beta hydrolase [Variovorax sp. J22G73]